MLFEKLKHQWEATLLLKKGGVASSRVYGMKTRWFFGFEKI